MDDATLPLPRAVISRIVSGFRDNDQTAAHVLRVSHCSRQLAVAAGLPADEAANIAEAAMLHDIGKMALPSWITNKPGPLTPTERAIVQTHTHVGAEILRNGKGRVQNLARTIALTHHERWNGTGYPAGLSGPEIPLAGRIVSIADQYEALRSERPYKRPLPHARVCEILLRGDERTRPEHFDPALLRIFHENSSLFAAVYAGISDAATLNHFVTRTSEADEPLRVSETPVLRP